MRLHHTNELALAQSVRIQELAALAGHELMSVVANIADQARTMLECAGAVCWAFDTEGRVTATRGSGDAAADEVLSWAGLNSADRAGSRALRDGAPGEPRAGRVAGRAVASGGRRARAAVGRRRGVAESAGQR